MHDPVQPLEHRLSGSSHDARRVFTKSGETLKIIGGA